MQQQSCTENRIVVQSLKTAKKCNITTATEAPKERVCGQTVTRGSTQFSAGLLEGLAPWEGAESKETQYVTVS